MEPDGCGGGEELEEVCCPGTVIEGQALGVLLIINELCPIFASGMFMGKD